MILKTISVFEKEMRDHKEQQKILQEIAVSYCYHSECSRLCVWSVSLHFWNTAPTFYPSVHSHLHLFQSIPKASGIWICIGKLHLFKCSTRSALVGVVFRATDVYIYLFSLCSQPSDSSVLSLCIMQSVARNRKSCSATRSTQAESVLDFGRRMCISP